MGESQDVTSRYVRGSLPPYLIKLDVGLSWVTLATVASLLEGAHGSCGHFVSWADTDSLRVRG